MPPVESINSCVRVDRFNLERHALLADCFLPMDQASGVFLSVGARAWETTINK